MDKRAKYTGARTQNELYVELQQARDATDDRRAQITKLYDELSELRDDMETTDSEIQRMKQQFAALLGRRAELKTRETGLKDGIHDTYRDLASDMSIQRSLQLCWQETPKRRPGTSEWTDYLVNAVMEYSFSTLSGDYLRGIEALSNANKELKTLCNKFSIRNPAYLPTIIPVGQAPIFQYKFTYTTNNAYYVVVSAIELIEFGVFHKPKVITIQIQPVTFDLVECIDDIKLMLIPRHGRPGELSIIFGVVTLPGVGIFYNEPIIKPPCYVVGGLRKNGRNQYFEDFSRVPTEPTRQTEVAEFQFHLRSATCAIRAEEPQLGIYDLMQRAKERGHDGSGIIIETGIRSHERSFACELMYQDGNGAPTLRLHDFLDEGVDDTEDDTEDDV